ncbi:MAG: efflux RND transporter periplasmic adaptor subunit [Chloroflexota bacterium]|nr:efflux RND transporter periplasmic adaptor subunit [Chloroflexota bacterium]
MKRRRVILIVSLVVAAVALGAGAFYFFTDPTAWESTLSQLDLAEPTDGGLTASGYIEAEEVNIASQIGGRVADVLAKDGDDVDVGTVLIRLDGTLLEARIGSARAGVEVAEARLAQVTAGTRPEQVRQAEAGLAQATVARDGAYQGWQDAEAMRDNPQELNARIAAARFEVTSAEAELAAATAMKDAAVISHDSYWDAKEKWGDVRKGLEKKYEEYLDAGETWEEIKKRLEEKRPEIPSEIPAQLDFHMIPYEYWKAWVGYHSADAKLDQARTSLNDLVRMRANPQELAARADGAKAHYEAAKAAVAQAEAQLEAVRSGATVEEIAVVEAQVEQAQASLKTLLSEREKLTIAAPVSGLILELTIHEGELAAPGATLVTLGDLDEVNLTVYVPQDRLGQVNVGQEADVRVDGFPGEVFRGTVVAIANQAEFIPRSIETKEERVSMVFAVEIAIANPDHKLKPGVPADATILTGEP